MSKQAIILRGPCGAGKTTLRQTAFPQHTVIDMVDAPRTSYHDRMSWLRERVAQAKMEGLRCIVVEGIFAPASPSVIATRQMLASAGFSVTEITVVRSMNDCLEARKNHPGVPALLRQYHHQFS